MLPGAACRKLLNALGKLVWSPQSNLRLYDETTDIVAALAAGVPVALGVDWAPSGSPSLLHELKVTWQVLCQTPGHPVKAPDLVRMVTSGAAEITGLADKIGTLEVGRAADLTILQKRLDDPCESVVSAYPSWVEMVMIGGDLVYGAPTGSPSCRPRPTTRRSRPGGGPCCWIPGSAPPRTPASTGRPDAWQRSAPSSSDGIRPSARSSPDWTRPCPPPGPAASVGRSTRHLSLAGAA